ncbi:MAG: amino acid adenylation domain-containing protein, partial [Acidobacteria bacterium]|nr:amino acid adenylation domain-containing protein [Acidobacteriota bacterium]
GKVEHFNIDFDLKEKLQRLSLASDATLFMVLLSSFAVILSRYSSQEDIVIGTPIANRNSRELEALIGFFINTLTIRIDLSNPSTFLELLKRVQNNCLEAYAYQDIPFEKLVEELQIERNPGYTPLFQVLFTLHHAGDNEFYLPGLVIRPLEIERLSSKFDLSLQLSESKLFISGSLEYNIHLFKSETIRRFIRCFLQALTIIADNPGVKLTDIEILPASERQQILYEFNNTASEYHKDKTVHQLFTGQAAQTPDYIALHGCMIAWMDACMDAWMHDCMDGEVARNVSLTYRQLNEQSDRLAGLLIEKGIGPDIIVALMMERSVEMIAGILGILKSGGAYLPIDPEYPQERIEYMLKDSAARILLTDDEKKTDNCQCSIVNCQLSMSERPRRGLLHSAFRIPHSNHLAYTIYTSGSTGKPKGVMIEHRAVVNFIKGITGIIPFTDSGRILSLTTVSFDIFGLETLLPLTRGTLIVIGNREEQLNALAAAKAIQRENITIFQVTPSRLQLFINDPAFAGALVCLKYLLVGGEVFPARLLEKIKQLTKGRIFNVYGPTETTIWSTIKEVTQTNSLTIGKPLANTQIYILDKHGLPQPIGVPGDLIIAGDGVARGYLNNPELTRKKFRPLIPLMTQMSLMKNKNNALRALDGCPRRGLQHSAFCIQHSNLYCTGDLARWLPDGDIEFLGRKDKQVKIRGYRIELDDIENQLLKYPGVQDVVVIVQADDSGDHFLSAYIVLHPDSSPGFDTSSLKQFLQEKIPAYMVPDYYVYLDKIPLNASGKVDIHSLPPVQSTRPAVKATYVAPNNELEQLITDTWKKVLKLENIGIYDNFFELGGNSFKVIELNTALGQTLKREIPVAVLFKYITIHSFTQYLIKEDMAPPTFPIESRKKPAAGQQSQRGKTDIAVIGMAGRFPGAANIDQFWENLKNGIESISFIPAAGTEKMGVPLEWRNNENYVGSLGGVLEGRDLFDANFFGYTPLEAEVMDPQMRLLHECVWETLENAGYEPGNYEGRIGLYAGASHNFYWESLVHMSGKSRELGGFLSLQFIGRDFLATRISYKLDLKGPCLNVQTACSTSLVAIHLACRAIWEDECDMALAGGVRVDAQDAHGYLYQEGMIHSKDGHCRAFDENASGTIGGNGAGVVMLKALPDALRDNDHIYALVKSTAINNDGTQKAGYTAPSIDGQAKVIKEAMEMAHVEPRSITYIEAHGTGTTLGDPIEIEALKMAFAVQEKGFCRIGSVKTNIGHLDAAAGAAGFIKTVLALKHRLIPPSLNFSHPNPRIDFKNSPFIVNDR